jgi:hypothetical protein
MTATLQHWLMPFMPFSLGGLLLYLHLYQGWERPWGAGGLFFVVIAVNAMLLNLAWTLPGPVGAFLRHPITNIVMFLSIACALGFTIVVGLMAQIR